MKNEDTMQAAVWMNYGCKTVDILIKALPNSVHDMITVRSSGKQCKQLNVCQML